MKKLVAATILSLALLSRVYAQTSAPPLRGPSGGPVTRITGAGCTQSGTTLTCAGGGGGGAATTDTFITQTPAADLSAEQALSGLGTGIVKNTTGTGVLSIAVGADIPTPVGSASALAADPADCSTPNFARGVNASGVAACAQPAYSELTGTPTIPADISGAHYVTTQAEAGLSAEAVVPTCTGTDKLTFNGTSLSCATDQTSAGGAYGTVQDEGTPLTQRATVNFIGAQVSCVDNAGSTRTDCTVTGDGTGAPTGATYLVDTADGTLSAEIAVGHTDDTTLVANGTTWQAKALPSCSNATTSKLLYDTATNTFSCGTDQAGGGGGPTVVNLTANFTTTATTATNVTGLSYAVTSGVRYGVECMLYIGGSVTTMAPNLAWTGPTMTYYVAYREKHYGTTSTPSWEHVTALSSFDAQTTITNASVRLMHVVHTIMQPSASGTMQLQVKSSSAGTSTVYAGSWCAVTTQS